MSNVLDFRTKGVRFGTLTSLRKIETSICFLVVFEFCVLVWFLELLLGSLSWFKFSPSWFMLDDFNKFDFEFQPSWRPTEVQKRKQKKKIHRGVQRLQLQET